MVSKGIRKFILSLQKKKEREEEKKYVIEGDKIVREFLNAGVPLTMLIAKAEFISQLDKKLLKNVDETIIATYEELKSISTLKTPHNALAVVGMPESAGNAGPEPGEFSIVLDCIQDPGNLGTIIRAAAWFGVRKVYCSTDSVDIYNSKVIQASMGAILSVEVSYLSLRQLIESASRKSIPVYGAVLDGKSIYDISDPVPGLIVFGNESKGISEELRPLITEQFTIPRFGKAVYGVESLNVGMAVSIVISDFTGRKKA